MAVRIRMKQMGRTHRHYYRIVAIDARQPRDGRVIEELGTYDPHVPETDSRVTLRPSRIKYWQSVGAKAVGSVPGTLQQVHEEVGGDGGPGSREGRRGEGRDGSRSTEDLISLIGDRFERGRRGRTVIRFDVLTLFPGIFEGYLRQSLLDDAIQAGLGAGSHLEHPRLDRGQAPEGR